MAGKGRKMKQSNVEDCAETMIRRDVVNDWWKTKLTLKINSYTANGSPNTY